MRFSLLIASLAMAAVLAAQSGRSYGPSQIWWEAGQGFNFPLQEEYDDPEGLISIFNRDGMLHTQGHAFFEALGTNGRACITCHQPSNGMSISTITLAERWKQTNGKDPIFAAF